jgi:hypothetical protein
VARARATKVLTDPKTPVQVVGVPVVPRVLLDHVHEDPTDVALPLRVVAPTGHDVVERPSGYRGASGVTFAPERGEISGCVGVIDLFEVQTDAVGVVDEG